MSTILQESFRRLAIRSPVKCSNCKRTLATSAVKNQQKSSTSNLYRRPSKIGTRQRSYTDERTESFQGSLGAKEQRKSSPFAQRTQAATATTTTAASTATATDSLQSQSAEQDQYDIAIASARESGRRAAVDKRAQELANLERTYTREDLERQIQRQWRVGDVYAPHDLSGIEMAKWKKVRRKPRPKFDALDVLGINPLHYYKVGGIGGTFSKNQQNRKGI